MNGDKLRDLHAEVSGIAGQARDDINRLRASIDALQSRPAPILKLEGGPPVWQPLTGEEKKQRENLKEQISDREKEAKKGIEEAIYKVGDKVSERDKAFIRSDAYGILGGREDFLRKQISNIPVAEQSKLVDRWLGRNNDGRSLPSSLHTTNQEKAPEQTQPKNLPDKGRISEEFNSHAAKEERGGYRSSPGKDAGPDTTKDPPRLPGGEQVKFTDGSKGSKFFAYRNPDADKSKEIPAPVRDEKFTDGLKSSRFVANKAREEFQPDRAAQPKPSKNPELEKSFAQNARDVSAAKDPAAKTEGRNSKFTDNSKSSKFLSPEYQAMLDKARQQKARGADRER